jgi:DNA-binding transcriptional ArsR family regulator
MTTAIEVLAEPSRRRILDVLRGGEQPVHEVVERVALSQPAVSKHLRVLRDAGLVSVRPDGQRRLYRVRAEPLMELDEWLAPYRRMWNASLDQLEDHLETRPDTNVPPSRRKHR